jgi:hypothetical protein
MAGLSPGIPLIVELIGGSWENKDMMGEAKYAGSPSSSGSLFMIPTLQVSMMKKRKISVADRGSRTSHVIFARGSSLQGQGQGQGQHKEYGRRADKVKSSNHPTSNV